MDNNEQIATPIKSGVKATAVGGLSALGTQLVKVLYPLGDPAAGEYAYKQDVQELLIAATVFLVPLIIFFCSLLSSRFIATPAEMDQIRRCKSDIKRGKEILKEAKKNPTFYTDEYLSEVRRDLEDSQRRLANVGKNTV